MKVFGEQLKVFIYSGLGSIVPSETQLWIYNKVSYNKLSKLLVISADDGGFHTPFLPSSISRKKLFKNIHKFIKNIINSHIYIDNSFCGCYNRLLEEKKHCKKKCICCCSDKIKT